MTLRAHLELPAGPRELAVRGGEAVVVDTADAGDVVAALIGRSRDRRHRIVLDGDRLDRRSVAGRVRAGLGVIGPSPVAPEVTVRDHLAAIVGARRADGTLAAAPLLAGRGGDRAGVLSGGERLVLAWLRCLVREPRAVVLDHAAAGLDDDVLAWAGDQVRAWRERGVALVIVPSRPQERAWAGSGRERTGGG